MGLGCSALISLRIITSHHDKIAIVKGLSGGGLDLL